jgi:type IV pilus assembly protein PilQ
MRAPLLVVLGIALAATPAAAERELCTRGAKYRGAAMDLDVKAADLTDVLRLLADVGKVNLVVRDDVIGRVTLRLKQVPWDQVLCTVAAAHKLTITVQDGILLVARRR